MNQTCSNSLSTCSEVPAIRFRFDNKTWHNWFRLRFDNKTVRNVSTCSEVQEKSFVSTWSEAAQRVQSFWDSIFQRGFKFINSLGSIFQSGFALISSLGVDVRKRRSNLFQLGFRFPKQVITVRARFSKAGSNLIMLGIRFFLKVHIYK